MAENPILNASSFIYSPVRRDKYFEFILIVCINIYYTITKSAIKIENNENIIRDVFIKYLQNKEFKKKYQLRYLKFDPETKERAGRSDIRVLPTKDEYIDDDAYYIIECKRLNSSNLTGNYGLNAEYIKNGICRFVSNYYSSYYDCNAMFGFVVEAMDINQNINQINALLPNSYTNQQEVTVNANAILPLVYTDFANGYPYSYVSKHRHISNKEFVLYHLMFDFSKNIQ